MVESTNKPRIFTIILATIGGLALFFVLLIVAFFAYLFHSFSTSVKSFSTMVNAPASGAPTKINYTVPTTKSFYIAGIKLSGEISGDTADEVIDKLETAAQDRSAVGILLEVNSPGGSVVPSQEIYDAIKRITTENKKPVVAYVREMAASGAYYSCASATKIFANRGSLIGSIGVIMHGFEVDKLVQFLKINPVTIKTGALKDTGSPFRPMNENDKKYLQGLVESTRTEFVNDVKTGRKVTDSTIAFMSDGRVLLAPQAVSLKLIDNIATKKEAVNEIAKLANQKKVPELYYYENIQNFSSILAQKLSGSVTELFTRSISGFL